MMDAPLSDRSRYAAWKLLLIAVGLMPAFGADARAQSHDPLIFQELSPIEDADPATRHKETIQVPTRLVFVQSGGQLVAGVDKEGFKPVEISVGLKMILGTRYNVIVYPVTQPRPAKTDDNWGSMMSGVEKDAMIHWMHPISAVSGEQYNVEMHMEVFETSLPPQHMWSPRGHQFKVLFSQTIKGIVTPKP